MRLIIVLLLRLLIFLVVLGLFLLPVLAFSLWQIREMDPDGWNRGVAEFLGWEIGKYALSTAEQKAAESAGLDPKLVEKSTLAELWADEQWGKGSGDRALYMALTQGETNDCRNAGTGFAAAEIRKRFDAVTAEKQIKALKKLLEIWQRMTFVPPTPSPLGTCRQTTVWRR